MALVGAIAASGCYSGPPATGIAWDPEADVEDTDGEDPGEDPTTEGADMDPDPVDPTDGDAPDRACEPLESRACTCDGGVAGEQWCSADGSAFLPCECDAPDPSGGPDEPEEPADEGEVCFLGADRSGTTCFEVYVPDQTPAGYEYPDPYQGNPNYRRPVAFIDLDAVDPGLMLAPNFRLDEIAQRYKGRYALVQPHAVASLQALRDAAGAIGVNSGYRSPAYNSQIGGATYSRHMYGDGFDLAPQSVSLAALEGICTDNGGMLVKYGSHVHCDFRFDDVDPVLFGDAAQAGLWTEPPWAAELQAEEGVFVAPAWGFDEGDPMREWAAYDEDGNLLAEAVGPIFVAPPGAARVEVDVGGTVWLGMELR
jgi:hypothetical protein